MEQPPSKDRAIPESEAYNLAMADISRRTICQRLGLLGMAIMLGSGQKALSFESPIKPDAAPKSGESGPYPLPLTPERFEELIGTVKETRARAVGNPEATVDFIRRFVNFSPRILAAKRAGGVVGSVFVNPPLAAIQLAVNLQLARDRTEPALLHNDLGRMAASQYWRIKRRDFIAIIPITVSLFGDVIHKNRNLLQMILRGDLPSDKTVQKNQDLESLIGRKLTFARLLVTGLTYAEGSPPIRNTDIWIDDPERSTVPEGQISVSLLTMLIRLEKAASAVRDITPVDALQSPAGWQDVSEAYRTFAVGQMVEAEREVANSKPQNAFEERVRTSFRANYKSYVLDIKKRTNWNDARAEAYETQKHGIEDLFTQQIFLDI